MKPGKGSPGILRLRKAALIEREHMKRENVQFHLSNIVSTDRLQDFLDYYEANPEIWRLFRGVAHEMRELNYESISAPAVVHTIRYKRKMASGGADGFKINNNYGPLYMRLLVCAYPEFIELVKFREVKAITQKTPHMDSLKEVDLYGDRK